MRVHDQLYPQAQAPAGEVHDEQRTGELHYSTGELPHLQPSTAEDTVLKCLNNVTLEISHDLYQDFTFLVLVCLDSRAFEPQMKGSWFDPVLSFDQSILPRFGLGFNYGNILILVI